MGLIAAAATTLRAALDYSEPYTVTTWTGSALMGSADGTGAAARFNGANGVAVDAAGNLYVADGNNDTIRKVTPAGVVSTLAGSPGQAGSADGAGSAARFDNPIAVAVDSAGNVYVADHGNKMLRKVTPAGVVTTLAGPSHLISGVPDVPGFSSVDGVAVDGAGTVYVSDAAVNRIAKFTAGGVASWFTGSMFSNPQGVAVDAAGNVYVADSGHNTVWKLTPDGTATALIGVAGDYTTVDGPKEEARIYAPGGVAVDGAGNVYLTQPFSSVIRRISVVDGSMSTYVGVTPTSGWVDGNASTASFRNITAIAAAPGGSLAVGDANTIRTVTADRTVATLAGNRDSFGAADGAGAAARFSSPEGVAVGTDEVVYVADSANHTVRKITPDGVVTTLAGLAGVSGSADGIGSAARFSFPVSVAVDRAGNVYVGDVDDFTVRKITPDGTVSTLAGQAGAYGSVDGTGSAARFTGPRGLAIDAAGNVYVADSWSNAIRRISPDGMVTTLAGQFGQYGQTDGSGSAARFTFPMGISISAAGDLYVSDGIGGATLRKVTPAGVVSTIAGTLYQSAVSDGPAPEAKFNYPMSVGVDAGGAIYVLDQGSNLLRKLRPDGTVVTVAGSVSSGSADGSGAAARFASPVGLAVTPAGVVYIADSGNNTIRIAVPAGPSLTSAAAATATTGRDFVYTVLFSGVGLTLSVGELPDWLHFDPSTGVLSGLPAQRGISTVALHASGSSGDADATLTITVNDAPMIGAIADQTLNENGTLAPVAFSVGDTETAAADLVVSAQSSNLDLVPAEAIVLSGSGADRTAAVTPVAGRHGTVTITLTVNDGTTTTTTSFALLVRAKPAIGAIARQVIVRDHSLVDLPFTVSDEEAVVSAVTVTAASSNQTLVPDAAIRVAGAGAARTLTVTPDAGQTGTTTITLTADDGIQTTSIQFEVAVKAAPTIAQVADLTIASDAAGATVALSIGDETTGPAGLTLFATCSDPTLIPPGNFQYVGWGADRTLRLTPAPGKSGTATVTVTVRNVDVTTTTSFTVTVAAGMRAPNLLWRNNTDLDLARPVARSQALAGNVIAVAGGNYHALLLKADRTLWGVGYSSEGELGTFSNSPTSAPVLIATDILAVAAGGYQTFYITTDGTLWALGSNNYGQLGDGTTTNRAQPVEVATGVTQVSAGRYHTVFIKTDGTLWGMGSNDYGQLGLDNHSSISQPVQIATNVVQASAGESATLAIKTDGSLWATGNDIYGQLGDGAATAMTTWHQVADGIAAVSMGSSDSFWVKTDGTLWAAGSGSDGQLGDGTSQERHLPVQIDTGVVAAAAASSLSLYRKQDGSLWGMGRNNREMLMAETAGDVITAPVKIDDDAVAVAVAGFGFVYLDSAGVAWGRGGLFSASISSPSYGQPAPSLMAADVVRFASASGVLLHLAADGTLRRRYNGRDSVVTTVAPVRDIAVGAGGGQSYYLTSDGRVCLIEDDLTSTILDSGVESLSASEVRLAYVKSDGTLWGIGWNNENDYTGRAAPVQLASAVRSVSTARDHLLFVKGDDTLWSLVPGADSFDVQQVAEGVTAASADHYYDVVLKNDGTLARRVYSWDDLSTVTSNPVLFTSDGERGLYYTNSNGDLWTVWHEQGASRVQAISADDEGVNYLQAGGSGALPVLTTQPTAATLSFGDRLVLTGAATGDGPIAYQWFKDGVAIAGADNFDTTTGISQYSTVFVTGADAGTYTLVATNAAGSVVSDAATVTVAPPPLPVGPPTIEAIADQTIPFSGSSGVLAVTIGDPSVPPDQLTVWASSSNPAIVPVANIVLGGSGAQRTVTITPALYQSGQSVITLTVSNGVQLTSKSFLTTINANKSPTIRPIEDVTIGLSGGEASIPFVVGDVETAPEDLTVWVSSSDTGVIDSSHVLLGGSGTDRTMRFRPSTVGTATITLWIFDGIKTSSTNFTVTVTAENAAPTISAIANQTIVEDVATGALALTVSDDQTAASALTVTGASSNPALIPNANILLGGSEANRTVTLTPVANASGTATIALTVSDGSLTSTTSFAVTVTAVNDAPTISAIANQTATEDAATSALGFTVGDVETAASALTVSATSSNQVLIPDANIVLGGSGANRTIELTPAANASGTATITLTVSDGALTATTSFAVTVAAVNDAPTITAITNQTVDEDTVTSALTFTVGDIETAAAALTVSATSSDPALIPDANVALGGSGANRTIQLTPAANASGSATITLTVSDGALTSTTSFTVTVTAVNDAPTIAKPADLVIAKGKNRTITFKVADAETTASKLVVTRSSSNPALLPTANLVLGGTSGNRTLKLTPVATKTGTATVTLAVSDGMAKTTTSFKVTVTNAPTIAKIPAQTTNEDTTTATIAVKIADADTSTSKLKLSATSSNATLVPAGACSFGGAGANRTLRIKPAANQNGTATITVTVSDGALTASTSFQLTVKAVNDRPTISAIANQKTNKNTATKAIAFKIADAETAATKLKLTKASSNTKLLPTTGIVLGGSGANRTVTLKPARNQTGTAKITLTVSDGQLSANRTFTLTVNAPPTISKLGNLTIRKNAATAPLRVTIGDAETPAAKLKLTAVSSNTTLVPATRIAFGGSGANRTIKVTPVTNRTGSTKITLTVSDGTATATTSFWVTVASAVKKTATPPAATAKPAITTQPRSQVAKAGATVTLTVNATGATGYQWTRDDKALAGAKAATLKLPAVSLTEAGGYAVKVTNAAGAVTSATAELTVVDAALAATRHGSILALTQTLTVAGASDGLTLSMLLPAGWTYGSGATAGAKTAPQAGDESLLEWTWATVPAKPLTFTYVLDGPASAALPARLDALVSVRQAGAATALLFEESTDEK